MLTNYEQQSIMLSNYGQLYRVYIFYKTGANCHKVDMKSVTIHLAANKQLVVLGVN